MVHQWKITTQTHSSLDFKSQRWRSCIWLWAKTWKNEFMLGLVCFCYLLRRKIPILWFFNAATLHLCYLLYSNCFTWFHLKDKYRNIDYFFLLLLVSIFIFSPYCFLRANHGHANACVSLCAVAERREGTAGRPTLDHVLTCFAFTCYST